MIAIERTAAMHAGELVPVRIDLRSLPPPSACKSSSSSRKVSSEPTLETANGKGGRWSVTSFVDWWGRGRVGRSARASADSSVAAHATPVRMAPQIRLGCARAVLEEEALGHGGVEEEDVHPRAADGEEVLGVPEQLGLILAVGEARGDPLGELLADGVALGGAERDVLGDLHGKGEGGWSERGRIGQGDVRVVELLGPPAKFGGRAISKRRCDPSLNGNMHA
eukprot:1822358-Prymnesium_polylepis.1